MNFASEIDFIQKTEIRKIQEKGLMELLSYLKINSPYYRKIFNRLHIDTDRIMQIEDLVDLPTTSKEDLQLFNDEFLCVPRTSVIEYTSTSGTLGAPVTIALTEKDLQRLAYNEFKSFSCAGGSPEDLYQLMLTLDRQFMAGMAYYSGIRKLGAGIIRLGPGVPSLQWETIQRLKPTTIVTVPSFVLKLIQFAKDNHIDINKSAVKKAICIGENIRN